MNKKKKEKNSTLSAAKFTKGLLFGGILGATITLFNAPKSGKKTRQTIINNVNHTKDSIINVKTSIEDVKTDTLNLETAAEELLPEFITSTKKAIRVFKFKTNHRISDINSQFKKIKSELNDLSKT